MINTITIQGRLGRDPELKTVGQKSLCTFSIAHDDGWGDNKRTFWIAVEAWEKKADFCAKHLRKGQRVTVAGRLKVREYEKDGQKRLAVEIVAQDVEPEWGDKAQGQPAATPAPAPERRQAPPQAWSSSGGPSRFDDVPPPDDHDGLPF